MSKKSDFDLGSITKKMNIGGLMDNVKSIISPTSITIDADDGDKIGALLSHLNDLVKEVSIVHEQQEQRLGNISRTSAQIYEALQAERAPTAEKKSEVQPKKAAPKKEAPKEAAADTTDTAPKKVAKDEDDAKKSTDKAADKES